MLCGLSETPLLSAGNVSVDEGISEGMLTSSGSRESKIRQ